MFLHIRHDTHSFEENDAVKCTGTRAVDKTAPGRRFLEDALSWKESHSVPLRQAVQRLADGGRHGNTFGQTFRLGAVFDLPREAERRLALLRPGAFVVNFARGGIVNESALTSALENGSVAGAAIDAFADEPPRPDSPLLALENVILSPHCASFSEDSRRRMSMQVAEGVRDVLEGRVPRFAANKAELYRR